MARWIQYSFLIGILMPVPLWAAEDSGGRDASISAGEAPVLDPRIERRRVKEADIDAENLEVSAFWGMYSSNDFGTSDSLNLRLAYHVSEDIFVEVAYGTTTLDETSYERLTPGVSLLTSEERELTHYSASIAYNLLPGESFLGGSRAFNNALYLLAGAGSTEFAGDDRFTINFGMGYRLLLTDWLSVRMEMRDYIYETDVLGDVDTTQNLEWSLGLGAFF